MSTSKIIFIVVVFVLSSIGFAAIMCFFYYNRSVRFSMYNTKADSHLHVYDVRDDHKLPPLDVNIHTFNLDIAKISGDLICRNYNKMPVTRYGINGHNIISSSLNNQNVFATVWSDKTNIWISFRGSIYLSEWMNNLKITQLNYRQASKYLTNVPTCMELNQDVMIHRGFIELYSGIKEPLYAVLNSLFNSKRKNIYISGHSLGGSVGTIFALDLKLAGHDTVVYSFASPKIGNQEFKNMIELHKVPVFRINNTEDIVSSTPLSVSPNFSKPSKPFFYTHCGEEHVFTDTMYSGSSNHSIGICIKNLDNLKSYSDK